VECLVLEAVILNNAGLSMLKQDYYYKKGRKHCGTENTLAVELPMQIVLL
jgi:hypothetical protein